MAIYQIATLILPKSNLIRAGKVIPGVLSVQDIKVDWWKESCIKTEYISSFFDHLLQKKNDHRDDFLYWKYSFQGDHDHDANLVLYQGRIGSLCVRFDLRESDAIFMQQVFDWLKDIDAVICFLDKREVIEPSLRNAAPILLNSTAHKFCSDPKGNIEDMN